MDAPAPLPANFFTLPPEMAWQVFEHLSSADLGKLARVNKQMAKLVEDFRNHQLEVFIKTYTTLKDS